MGQPVDVALVSPTRAGRPARSHVRARDDEVMDEDEDVARPWAGWALGDRVVVRYRREPAQTSGGRDRAANTGDGDRLAAGDGGKAAGGRDHATGDEPLTDALGVLVAADGATLTIRTRRGDVTVPLEAITLGKRVPPPPRRRQPGAGPQTTRFQGW